MSSTFSHSKMECYSKRGELSHTIETFFRYMFLRNVEGLKVWSWMQQETSLFNVLTNATVCYNSLTSYIKLMWLTWNMKWVTELVVVLYCYFLSLRKLQFRRHFSEILLFQKAGLNLHQGMRFSSVLFWWKFLQWALTYWCWKTEWNEVVKVAVFTTVRTTSHQAFLNSLCSLGVRQIACVFWNGDWTFINYCGRVWKK